MMMQWCVFLSLRVFYLWPKLGFQPSSFQKQAPFSSLPHFPGKVFHPPHPQLGPICEIPCSLPLLELGIMENSYWFRVEFLFNYGYLAVFRELQNHGLQLPTWYP